LTLLPQRWLILLILVQFALGFAALVATGATSEMQDRPAVDVSLTTAHQAVGALILGAAALLAVWSARLLAVPSDPLAR